MSPLSLFTTKKVITTSAYQVIGFLPPWTIATATIRPEVLDELIFLGIEVKANGDLVWDSQSKKIYQAAYLAMKKKMKENGKKNIMGIKLFEDKKIDQLLASEEARQKLISQINELVNSEGFDGVNVDFEYQGNPVAVLEDEFVAFIGELRTKVGKPVSVDVFGNTIIKGNIEANRQLAATADEVIIMAYDFNRPGGDYAGPTAPINSLSGRSIREIMEKIVEMELPRKKMIMAYPLYGYEYRTVDGGLEAETVGGWGQTATLKRVNELLATNKITSSYSSYSAEEKPINSGEMRLYFDEISQTPWTVQKKTETVAVKKRVKIGKVYKTITENQSVERYYQIYFDNADSLAIKFKLVKEGQLGGVGFWALGYEGGDSAVWQQVNQILR